MTTGNTSQKQAIIVLAVAFSAWLLTNFDQSLFGYVVPQVMAEFGFSLPEISYIISLSFIAGMVLPVGIGVMTDRIGARWTLPLCLGLSAILVGVQGLVAEAYAFTSARVLSFGLSSALSPITSAIVLAAAPVKWRVMMVAILQCAYPLGWLLSSLIVSPLIDDVSWRTLFMVGFIVAPIGVLLGLMLPKEKFGRPTFQALAKDFNKNQRKVNKPLEPIKALFSSQYLKTTLLCALAFFFYAGSVAATAFFLPTFLNEARGYSLSDSALIVGSGYGFSVIGYLGAAAVSTFLMVRRDAIILWNVVAAVLFTAMLWLPQTFWQDFIAFGILGIFYYGTSAILITYVMEAFPEGMRATAAAVCGTACVSASMATYPIAVAWLVPGFGWEWTFNMLVTTSLLLSALAMCFLPRYSHAENPNYSDSVDNTAASEPKPSAN